MFLNLLTKSSEKALFLKLAYLVAVAHSSSVRDSENTILDLNISSRNRDSIKCTDEFLVNRLELEFLKNCSKEMDCIYEFNDVRLGGTDILTNALFRVALSPFTSIFMNKERKIDEATTDFDNKLFVKIPGYYMAELPEVDETDGYEMEEDEVEEPFAISFNHINEKINEFSDANIYSVAVRSSNLLQMLSTACNSVTVRGLSKLDVRQKTLDLAIIGALACHNEVLTFEVKKAMLFELTVMAHSGDSLCSEERRVLALLFKHLNVDLELLEKFALVAKSYMDITEQAIGLVAV